MFHTALDRNTFKEVVADILEEKSTILRKELNSFMIQIRFSNSWIEDSEIVNSHINLRDD